jgi:DNA-binding MarR family transcriptional regulator
VPTINAAPASRRHLVNDILGELEAGHAAGDRVGIRALIGRSVSLTHLHVAAILQLDGPLSMGHLAKALDVSVASATGIVSRMEERGLVARHHDERDRRVVEVGLTPDGQGVLDEIDDRRHAFVERLLDELTTDELQHLLIGVNAMQRTRRHIATDHDTPCGSPKTDCADATPAAPR